MQSSGIALSKEQTPVASVIELLQVSTEYLLVLDPAFCHVESWKNVVCCKPLSLDTCDSALRDLGEPSLPRK